MSEYTIHFVKMDDPSLGMICARWFFRRREDFVLHMRHYPGAQEIPSSCAKKLFSKSFCAGDPNQTWDYWPEPK